MAWIVILTLTLVLPLFNHLGQRAAQPGSDDGEDIQMRMVARYAIGAETLMQMVPGRTDARVTAQILPQLDGLPQTLDNRIRSAIVVREIKGAESALERLEGIELDAHPDRASEVQALRVLFSQGPDALDEQQRSILIERYGWLAEVALTHHLPADDPVRRQVRQPAVRAFIAYMVATFGGMALALGGAALLVVGFILWRNGQLPMAYRPSPPPTGAYLEAFAVYLGIWVGLSLVISSMVQDLLVVVGISGLVALGLGLLWPILRGRSGSEWRQAFGLNTGRGVIREIFAGVVGWMAFLPVLILGIFLTYYLSSRLGFTGPVGHPIQREILAGGQALLGAFILGTIWAPISEELMFRGAFQHHLRTWLNALLSVLVVGVIFALVHPQGLIAVPVLTLVAVMLGLVREWRGSIIAPMAAHAMNNGMVLLLLMLLVG